MTLQSQLILVYVNIVRSKVDTETPPQPIFFSLISCIGQIIDWCPLGVGVLCLGSPGSATGQINFLPLFSKEYISLDWTVISIFTVITLLFIVFWVELPFVKPSNLWYTGKPHIYDLFTAAISTTSVTIKSQPSCESIVCRNGGYCVPQPRCVCPSYASGEFCEGKSACILLRTIPSVHLKYVECYR